MRSLLPKLAWLALWLLVLFGCGEAPESAEPAETPGSGDRQTRASASQEMAPPLDPPAGSAHRGPRSVRRLLVLALDGATWKLLSPLIDEGRLPTFERLLGTGVWAELETLEPTVSPAIWTTIATGTPPQRHGILGFDGIPGQTMETLPNASMRRVKAWWEILDEAGLSSGTMGWWASWPADRLRAPSYLVSDRVPYSRMEAASGQHGLDDRDTEPAALLATLESVVEKPNDIDPAAVQRFLHLSVDEMQAQLIDAEFKMGRYLPEFKFVYQSDRSTWKIARELIARRPVDVTAVYFTGIDTVSHLYWHFLFPHEFPDYNLNPEKVRKFGDVIPLYYELMDEYLADLLGLLGEDTTVMIVSDHGFGGTGRLPWAGGHGSLTPGAPIAPPGVLILSGPGVAGGGRRLERAHVLDIAPTLLALMGLPAGSDMPGVVLHEALVGGAKPPPRIASWEQVGPRRSQSIEPVDPRGDRDRMQRLRALGYIE